jgi:streptogramin lyase
MAKLTRWPVPTELGNYLQFLTPERDGKIYYTKYIINKIGELDLARNIVTEWQIPANLLLQGSGDPIGITYGPDGLVWFALQRANKLVRFNPATGAFLGYGSGAPMGYPTPSPRFLMFDASGGAWYTGSGKTGGLIGRLDPIAAKAGYWDLPPSLWSPEGLSVDSKGNAWFTPFNPNNGAMGASFARATAPAQIVQWTIAPGGQPPFYPGVVADGDAKNIWLTYDWGQGIGNKSMRVFRFHTPSGTCFGYPHARQAHPRKIALDSAGNAWLTDWNARLSTIAAGANCGTVRVQRQAIEKAWKEEPVKMFRGMSEPKRKRVQPTTIEPDSAKVECYLEYAIPAIGKDASIPHGIAINDNGERRVYFTDFGLNRICRLVA